MRRHWLNYSMTVAIVALCLLVAEATTRYLDNLPVFGTSFPEGPSFEAATAEQRDKVPLAPGVSPAWFSDDPPELPNRGQPSAEWRRRFEEVLRAQQLASATGPVYFQPADILKV